MTRHGTLAAMTTRRTMRVEYSVSPARIADLLRDPDFLRRRCEAAGEKNVDVAIEEHPDGLRVVVARDKEVDLPGFAKRMFSPKNRIVDDTRWRLEGERWLGQYRVEITGVPGEVRGESQLVPTASGCAYESSFAVEARIPLIGNKLEAFVADRVEETFWANARRNEERLAT